MGFTCDVYINSQKTGERNVNGIAGSFFVRLIEFYEAQGITLEPDDYMFVDVCGRRKGQQIDKYVLNRLFRELMSYAGLERIKFTPYHLDILHYKRLMNGVDVVLLVRMLEIHHRCFYNPILT